MIGKYPEKISRVFKENPDFNYVPEFKKLDDAQMCFVMLVADPFSALRRLTLSKSSGDQAGGILRRRAAKAVGWVDEDGLTADGEGAAKGLNNDLEEAIVVYGEMFGMDPIEGLLSLKKAYQNLIEKVGSMKPTQAHYTKLLTQTRSLVKDEIFLKIEIQQKNIAELYLAAEEPEEPPKPQEKKAEKEQKPVKDEPAWDPNKPRSYRT